MTQVQMIEAKILIDKFGLAQIVLDYMHDKDYLTYDAVVRQRKELIDMAERIETRDNWN